MERKTLQIRSGKPQEAKKEVTAPVFCIWILENQSPNIDSCIQM
jgi:hypothetical protein